MRSPRVMSVTPYSCQTHNHCAIKFATRSGAYVSHGIFNFTLRQFDIILMYMITMKTQILGYWMTGVIKIISGLFFVLRKHCANLAADRRQTTHYLYNRQWSTFALHGITPVSRTRYRDYGNLAFPLSAMGYRGLYDTLYPQASINHFHCNVIYRKKIELTINSSVFISCVKYFAYMCIYNAGQLFKRLNIWIRDVELNRFTNILGMSISWPCMKLESYIFIVMILLIYSLLRTFS